MIRPPIRRRIAPCILLIALAVGIHPLPAPVFAQAVDDGSVIEGPLSDLTVTTATGVYPFQVELAATPELRSRGLMFRRTLDPDRGMLFDMGGVGQATFWMENTYISLDIAFIDETGRVVNVAEDARPLSRALIPSKGPVRWVLELKAGTAARIGLAPGNLVAHSVIPKG